MTLDLRGGEEVRGGIAKEIGTEKGSVKEIESGTNFQVEDTRAHETIPRIFDRLQAVSRVSLAGSWAHCRAQRRLTVRYST